MLQVRAERLGFSFSDRVLLLSDVTFHLVPGWYGVVGKNGAGKTTLAHLLTGALRPTSGRLTLEPPGARVSLVAQELDSLSDELRAFAKARDRESVRMRALLRLDPGMLERFLVLSAGERKRWQLGAALATLPDLLILDEPTNHLDLCCIERLEQALVAYPGALLLVSHDQLFAERCTTSIWEIREGRVHGSV